MGPRMVRGRSRIAVQIGAAITACVAVQSPAEQPASTAEFASAGFSAINSPIEGLRTEDLGVVDANGDGLLDLFTSNHEYEALLLLAEAGGGFENATESWRFGIDPDVPGIEAASVVDLQEGLHIFFKRGDLVLRAHKLPPDALPLRGRVELPRPTKWITDRGVRAADPEGTSGSTRTVEFVVDGGGQLRFLPTLPTGTITVELAPSVPLEIVRLGQRAVPARSHRLGLFQVDRHGMAWNDFDADGDVDVFISSGGALGMLSKSANDELLVHQGGRFRNGAGEAGIDKHRSRGRRVEWVDHDDDGRLDLYVGNFQTPNRLWARREDGRFTDRAPALALAFKDGDQFRWFDIDRDGDADLLVAGRGGPARLFRNDGGSWSKMEIGGSETDDPRQLSLADLDADGDVDVLVVDGSRNRLLLADGSSFVATDPTEIGLPERALTANWVDFDNDGRVDLHTVPGGLFHQRSDGRFDAVGLAIGDGAVDAHCAWLDLDADGDRDCLCDLNTNFYDVDHVAYRNDRASGHWLTLDLVGPPSNPNAIGASVVAETSDGRRQTHVVGEAEGAHFSQGHYRIYLGLGTATELESLEIVWPGGQQQRQTKIAADRVHRIRQVEAD